VRARCCSTAAAPASAAAFSQLDIATMAAEPNSIDAKSPNRERASRTAGKSRSI